MDWKSFWYSKRRLKLIAVYINQRTGEDVTWQDLCDRKGNGHRYNGGYGSNVYVKLIQTGRSAGRISGILDSVMGYTRQEAVYLAAELN